MEIAYIVHHIHIITDENEDSKLIGVYSSIENATTAINKIKDQLGFKDNPETIDADEELDKSGFYISKYTINKTQWLEGFVTV